MRITKCISLLITGCFLSVLCSCGSKPRDLIGEDLNSGIRELGRTNHEYFNYNYDILSQIRSDTDHYAKDHWLYFYKYDLPRIKCIEQNLNTCQNMLRHLDSALSARIFDRERRIRDDIYSNADYFNRSSDTAALDTLINRMKEGLDLADSVNAAFSRVADLKVTLTK